MSETTASASATTASAASTSATTASASIVGQGPVPSPSVPQRVRRGRVALRVVQVLLALFFAFASALPKLIAHSSAAESFETMGWGSAGMYAIGALELAGAVGLLVPVLQSAAATGLSALMVGAFVVQVAVFDGEFAATPLILMVPLVLIAWSRRGHNADLLSLLRGKRSASAQA
ncbi:DoxX family protein [Streptomyces sp. enrichment culture]|uniref:DoxX family protein n=1 Tax=Streptomyces sp. enrichment culture TaxID=1795815 RepID=UPI003F55CE04